MRIFVIIKQVCGNMSELVSYGYTSYLASFIIAYGSEYVSSAIDRPGLSVCMVEV
jgi:hypothetical protein